MPTISTIRPGGGGDFTSLGDWWDFAKDEANADQWAECYEGGDLGVVNIFGFEAVWTASTENYPRVYAAPGQRPACSNLSVFSNYVRVEGIDFQNAGLDLCSLIDKCTFNPSSTVGIGPAFSGPDETVVRNCVFYGPCSVNNVGGSQGNVTTRFQNCSFLDELNDDQGVTDAGLVFDLRNCILASLDLADVLAGISNSVLVNYCLTADSSLNLYTGANNIINTALANVYRNPAGNDLRLKQGSPAINAGDTIGAVTDDILGVARPSGAAYDMGAYEGFVGGGPEVEATTSKAAGYGMVSGW